MTQITFGDTLKRIRTKRKVSMNVLADRAGFHHSWVSRLESPRWHRQPSRETVERLCTALRVTVAERQELLAAGGFLPDAPEALLRFPILHRLNRELTRLSDVDPASQAKLCDHLGTLADWAATKD